MVNIVTLIRGGNKDQRHREFIALLEEMDADYSDIPLHCDIRWLSARKCLFEHTYTSDPHGLGTLTPIEFFQQDLLWEVIHHAKNSKKMKMTSLIF
jgi:hypothetical protein